MAALTGLATDAPAQRGVVFQHGLNSNGDTWAQASDRLALDYHIAGMRPTTNSFALFGTQASQLAAQVASSDANAVIIGHSNGGLLARTANRPDVQNRSWGGIVTVGTPHGGAPLAASVLNGRAISYGQSLASRIVRPFAYYSVWQADWRDRWYWWIAAGYANSLYTFAQYFPYHLQYSIGVAVAVPVTQQMPPNASFIADINSPTNLGREASALPHRIGVTSSVNGYAGMTWKGLTPDSWRQNTVLQYSAALLLLAVFEHYHYYDNYNDPYWFEKRQYAPYWLMASAAVFGMDNAWCSLIGASRPDGRCAPSDGIVPTTSQVYPGGTANLNAGGSAHAQQTRDYAVEGRIRESFDRIGITPCSRVGSIALSPTTASLVAGASLQLSASVSSVCGRSLATSVSWQSANTGIATISSSGVVSGVSAGTTTIYASRDGVTAGAAVTVSGGSGGPSSVTVSGPTSVVACATDEWYATTVGGTAPLSFRWEFNGHVVETGSQSWVEYQNMGGSALNVRVTVTDAQGRSRTSATRSVPIEGECW